MSGTERRSEKVSYGRPRAPQTRKTSCAACRLEARVRVFVGIHALRHDLRVRGELQRRVKARAGGVLDAVCRPRSAVDGEMSGFRGMPVARGEDRRAAASEAFGVAVEEGHDLVARRYRKRAAGTEVVLDVDNDEGITRGINRESHGIPPGRGWRRSYHARIPDRPEDPSHLVEKPMRKLVGTKRVVQGATAVPSPVPAVERRRG